MEFLDVGSDGVGCHNQHNSQFFLGIHTLGGQNPGHWAQIHGLTAPFPPARSWSTWMWPFDPSSELPHPTGISSCCWCCHPRRFWLQKSTPCWIWDFFPLHFLGGAAIPAAGNEEISSRDCRKGTGSTCIPNQQLIPHGNVVIP